MKTLQLKIGIAIFLAIAGCSGTEKINWELYDSPHYVFNENNEIVDTLPNYKHREKYHRKLKTKQKYVNALPKKRNKIAKNKSNKKQKSKRKFSKTKKDKNNTLWLIGKLLLSSVFLFVIFGGRKKKRKFRKF